MVIQKTILLSIVTAIQFPQLRNSSITMTFFIDSDSLFDDLQRKNFKIVNVLVPNINTDKNNFQSNTK